MERLSKAAVVVSTTAFAFGLTYHLLRDSFVSCPLNATEVSAMVGGKAEQWRQVTLGSLTRWELRGEEPQTLIKPKIGRLFPDGNNKTGYAEYRCPENLPFPLK